MPNILNPGNVTKSKNTKASRKVKVDALLDTSKKKLTSLEAQRLMSVFVALKGRVDIVIMLPYIATNLVKFQDFMDPTLVSLLEKHRDLQTVFCDVKDKIDLAQGASPILPSPVVFDSSPLTKTGSAMSLRKKRNSGIEIFPVSYFLTQKIKQNVKVLELTSVTLKESCVSILRILSLNHLSTLIAYIRKEYNKEYPEKCALVMALEDLNSVVFERLKTTRMEDLEKQQYLQEITDRDKKNREIIAKLEADVESELNSQKEEIKKCDTTIDNLENELYILGKSSMGSIRKTIGDAEKLEKVEVIHSENRQNKLQDDLAKLKFQYSNLLLEHRLNEQHLLKRKYKTETEVENWINKYDADMGERQAELDEISREYNEKKAELHELEERFRMLEEEYNAVIEERSKSENMRVALIQLKRKQNAAATTIQALWRGYRVRKQYKIQKKGAKAFKKEKGKSIIKKKSPGKKKKK